MEKLVRYIGYAVVIFFLFALTMATVPYSLGGWATFFIIRPIWRRHRARTADEREMMGYAAAQARDEAERIRMQAKIDQTQERILHKARQDAGLEKKRRNIFVVMFFLPFHIIFNFLREITFQKTKPFEWYK